MLWLIREGTELLLCTFGAQPLRHVWSLGPSLGQDVQTFGPQPGAGCLVQGIQNNSINEPHQGLGIYICDGLQLPDCWEYQGTECNQSF